MAFHGVVCCLHRCQMVIRLWHVRQPTNLPQAYLTGYEHACNTGGPWFDFTLKCFFIYVKFSHLRSKAQTVVHN